MADKAPEVASTSIPLALMDLGRKSKLCRPVSFWSNVICRVWNDSAGSLYMSYDISANNLNTSTPSQIRPERIFPRGKHRKQQLPLKQARAAQRACKSQLIKDWHRSRGNILILAFLFMLFPQVISLSCTWRHLHSVAQCPLSTKRKKKTECTMFMIDYSKVGLGDTYCTFSISIIECPRLELKGNVVRFVVESSSKSVAT